jgi:hypothetical protein
VNNPNDSDDIDTVDIETIETNAEDEWRKILESRQGEGF